MFGRATVCMVQARPSASPAIWRRTRDGGATQRALAVHRHGPLLVQHGIQVDVCICDVQLKLAAALQKHHRLACEGMEGWGWGVVLVCVRGARGQRLQASSTVWT